MSGNIWGMRSTEDGDFVQFSADGEWHRYEVAAVEEQPAPTKSAKANAATAADKN